MTNLTHIEARNEYNNYCNALQQGTKPMSFENYCKISGITITAY